jgi:hypothetical protein
MKVYKFGDSGNFYELIIEEDNGDKKVAVVCNGRVKEYVAKEVVCKGGYTRLTYGGGSSMPYKNADGTINSKYKEVKNE